MDNYDSILIVVNQLFKMIHYKPVKNITDAVGMAKIIIDMVVMYHGYSKFLSVTKAHYLL